MSKYDGLLEKVRSMYGMASKEIPKLYEALIEEGLSPQDARERIEKDLIDMVSKRTILRYLPDEAKHQEMKRERPTKKQMMIEVANSGHQQLVTEPEIIDNNTTTTPRHVFDKTTIDMVKSAFSPTTTTATTPIVLHPNPVWRGKIIQRMNQGADVYLVTDGQSVIDVRDKP